jgi:hypothetical protein
MADKPGPSKEQIEVGALAIMNERLTQGGIPALTNLDMLYPQVLLEVMADSEAALRAVAVPELQRIERLEAVNADLLTACKQQHDAIDMLFALLITRSPRDDVFYPSKSGAPWDAAVAGNAAIAKAEAG